MSNESKALAIIPRTVDEVRSLAAMFAKSSLLPDALRGKEADVFVSIMAGQELGLPPMVALRGVHVVKGRPVLSADTMVGIVLGSGLAEHFTCTQESDTSVTYETKRKGSPHPQTCTWTIQDANRAGLGGDNWKKYPRAMLKARCKAMLARDVYPDVLAGCYDADELREEPREPERHVEVVDAEIVSGNGGGEPDCPYGGSHSLPAAKPRTPADEADELCALVETITKATDETSVDSVRDTLEKLKAEVAARGARMPKGKDRDRASASYNAADKFMRGVLKKLEQGAA